MTSLKLNFPRLRSGILILAGVSAVLFSACKGRTATDMVPSGDTVEVIINPPADSIPNSIQSDSLTNEN